MQCSVCLGWPTKPDNAADSAGFRLSDQDKKNGDGPTVVAGGD